MRHVDEGTIHAWLDGEIADAAEAAWIDEHLRWCAACGALVAEERAVREQAHALLAIASPTAEPPAFHELTARAEAHAASASATTSARLPLRHSGWFLKAGWAASVLLAATTGWTARELLDRGPVETVALAPAPGQPPAVNAPTPSASADAAAPETQAATQSPGARASRQATRTSAADFEQRADRLREESAQPGAAAQPAQGGVSFLPPRRSAPAANRATIETTANAAAPATVAAPPVAVVPPPVAAAPPAVVPQLPQDLLERTRAAAAASPGRLATVSEIPAASITPIAAADWQVVPRTEAAVRSGMALYGIEGMEPAFTAISTDRRMVRTVYRLESGVSIDLEQQRSLPNGASITSLQPATTRSLPSTGRVIPPAAGAVMTNETVAPHVWFDVRGGQRLMLRTTADAVDLAALGARLRIQ